MNRIGLEIPQRSRKALHSQTNSKLVPPGYERALQERIHDPYQARQKMRGPLLCPRCKAVCFRGTWQWKDSWPDGTGEMLCPACRRIADHCAAGILNIQGGFVGQHRAEVLNLIHHIAQEEEKRHPLHRMMAISEKPNGTVIVNTTDIHLPGRIGHALKDAYAGVLSIDYQPGSYSVRIKWTRNT